MGERWNSVAETPTFASKARTLLNDDERADLIALLARDPECGDVIPDTGGVRKVRVALEGRGKSGGARVIYYFQNEDWPLIILTIYAKNEIKNLNAAARNALAKLVAELKATRKKGRAT